MRKVEALPYTVEESIKKVNMALSRANIEYYTAGREFYINEDLLLSENLEGHDKSFIDKISYNTKTAAIVKYIINLAHDLGFQVVAEGIENEDQFNFLRDNNCDIYQGYFFNKPLSPQDFLSKLETQK